eukprot:gnl/MRDRNA2_/MRDRNA2_119126_c0_seq1.p1 gnl/MRDRNA2_/MRDRNA2_119126_c0~~gnl/MRDRNA2_/MRDRNA2_119126_c0_seq1.p1  ORF type:complete len:997 (-),score=207.36 gnl/MRDRNA2_/MRDRNA2_119126_c0_seq1:83-3073(-)
MAAFSGAVVAPPVAEKLQKLGVSNVSVDYVRQKLNPLVHELFAYLLRQRPDNPETAVILWVLERAGAPKSIICNVQSWINGEFDDDKVSNGVAYTPSRKSEWTRASIDDAEASMPVSAALITENKTPFCKINSRSSNIVADLHLDEMDGQDGHEGQFSSRDSTMNIEGGLGGSNSSEAFSKAGRSRRLQGKKSTMLYTPAGTAREVDYGEEEQVDMSNEEVLEIIKDVPCFKGLADQDFKVLAKSLEVQRFPENSIIANYGAEGAGMHIIVDGEAKVYVPQEVAVLGAGQTLGQATLFDGTASQEIFEAANGSLTTLKLTPLPFKALDIKKKTKGLMQKKVAAIRRDKAKSKFIQSPLKKGQHSDCEEPAKSLHLVRPNDSEEQELIIEALKHNKNLTEVLTLDTDQMLMMVRACVRCDCQAGDIVFDAGDAGEAFYIIGEGIFKIFDPAKGEHGEGTMKFRQGQSFGELALLYDAPRNRTVKCSRKGFLWVVSQHAFQSVMQYRTESHLQEYSMLIESVPDLKQWMGREDYASLSAALEEMYFIKGETVVTQGDLGQSFYIIFNGTCNVVIDGEIVKDLGRGDYFGEKALFQDEPRGATVRVTSETCTLLALDRVAFNLLFTTENKPIRRNTRKSAMNKKEKEEDYVPLRRLQTIGPLGQGAFGKVTLEKDPKTLKLYALKAMSKAYILQERLKQAVENEVSCMGLLHSEFIVKMTATYRDKDYVYIALEPCLGGELFDVYNEQALFGLETHCRFYAACVSMGLEHMHYKRIIYRDLKLENCLLTLGGYLKLTDLGLAKAVLGKTYTVCGTTDYFAPETLRQTGHNRACDWWALGVLIFIMMTSTSPFAADDVMHTYKKIIKGISKVIFPEEVPDTCRDVICALCQKKPEERLTMGSRGVENLKDHPWNAGFDWLALCSLQMKSPWKPNTTETEIFNHIANKQMQDLPACDLVYEDDGTDWEKVFDDERADLEDLDDDLETSRTCKKFIRPTLPA